LDGHHADGPREHNAGVDAGSAKDRICSVSAGAVKTNTRMQPKLNTVAERTGLFKIDRMAVLNLRCIPTSLFVEMQPKLTNSTR